MLPQLATSNDPLSLPYARGHRGLIDELRVRLVICFEALLTAFVISAYALPFAPMSSFTEMFIFGFTQQVEAILSTPRPAEWVAAYSHVVCNLALILAQPVIGWQVLDALAPQSIAGRDVRIRLTLLALCVSFTIGITVACMLILPTLIDRLLRWTPPYIMHVEWQFGEYVKAVSTLVFSVGAACEIPALMVGLVWLRILTHDQMAADRLYALLLAFVAGA